MKYEDLQDEFRKIAPKMELDDQFFSDLDSIRMKSGTAPISHPKGAIFELFPETVPLIATICAEEINTFGYETPQV